MSTVDRIIEDLCVIGAIKTLDDNPKGWRLVSGMWSPFYINLRFLSSVRNAKELLGVIGREMGNLIKREFPEVSKIVGVAMAGIPIALAITLEAGIPCCYTRKLPVKNLKELEDFLKSYGEHALVEGNLEDGESIVIVDDLVTTFESKLMAIEQVRREAERRGVNVKIEGVAVVIDREQKINGKTAKEIARENGYKLVSLLSFRRIITYMKSQNLITPQTYEKILRYLEENENSC